MKLNIIKLDENDQTALATHYHGQSSPQECYIELDTRDGSMTADYNVEIGHMTPLSVWKGEVRRWKIPLMTTDRANQLMDEIAPKVQELLDEIEGCDEWSDYATQLEDEIEGLCNEYEGNLAFFDGYEYIYDSKEDVRQRIAKGDSVEEIASDYRKEAFNEYDECHYILEDIEEAILAVKEEMEDDENNWNIETL